MLQAKECTPILSFTVLTFELAFEPFEEFGGASCSNNFSQFQSLDVLWHYWHIYSNYKFLDEAWVSMHVTMGLFEIHVTLGQSMAIQLQALSENYGLLHWVITFVKYEGSNLIIMATAPQSIVDYEPLKLHRVYKGTCFGHICLKCVSMLLMMTKSLFGWKVLVWRMQRLVYKKQYLNQKL
jgi:hypothetical protein